MEEKVLQHSLQLWEILGRRKTQACDNGDALVTLSCSLSEELTLELRSERPDKQREIVEQAEGTVSA